MLTGEDGPSRQAEHATLYGVRGFPGGVQETSPVLHCRRDVPLCNVRGTVGARLT